MTLTPSLAKNLMRRSLRQLVDPELTAGEKQRIREYFRYRCAYCDIQLEGVGHDIDHLISASLGGGNAIANRVLSCKPCNAKEKRDSNWVEFLNKKAPVPIVFEQRKSKIDAWVEMNGGHPALEENLMIAIEEGVRRTSEEYDIACSRIRDLRSV